MLDKRYINAFLQQKKCKYIIKNVTSCVKCVVKTHFLGTTYKPSLENPYRFENTA